MAKSVWRVYAYVDFEEGWVPVSWAPEFSTEAEANEWISNPDHDWDEVFVRPVERFLD